MYNIIDGYILEYPNAKDKVAYSADTYYLRGKYCFSIAFTKIDAELKYSFAIWEITNRRYNQEDPTYGAEYIR